MQNLKDQLCICYQLGNLPAKGSKAKRSVSTHAICIDAQYSISVLLLCSPSFHVPNHPWFFKRIPQGTFHVVLEAWFYFYALQDGSRTRKKISEWLGGKYGFNLIIFAGNTLDRSLIPSSFLSSLISLPFSPPVIIKRTRSISERDHPPGTPNAGFRK